MYLPEMGKKRSPGLSGADGHGNLKDEVGGWVEGGVLRNMIGKEGFMMLVRSLLQGNIQECTNMTRAKIPGSS